MPNHHLVGKYRLVRAIGRGAMGEVWAAVNIDTDRDVALKLITSPDPEVRRRLLREGRAIGRLEHPNIVQILDRGETETGIPFLVMQLLVGETLADRLRRERALSPSVAAGVALDVARALRAAHDKDIVHRDLKPANIFLHREPDTDAPVVKVVDFGVSQLSIENEGSATVPGGMLGSPAYMSPEQIRGGAVDGRADLWALGVVLFEMLAGIRPFPGSNAVVVLGQILTQPVPRIDTLVPGVDRALADVLASCLERDPARRIRSAADLGRALRPFTTRPRFNTLGDPASSERIASLPEPPRPVFSRESNAPTSLFQRDMLPAARSASGTVLMPPAPSRGGDRESAPTTLFEPAAIRARPPAPPAPPPPDEDERPTHEMIRAAPPAPPRVLAATQPIVPVQTPVERVGHGTIKIDPVAPAPWRSTVPWAPSSAVTTATMDAPPPPSRRPVLFLIVSGVALLVAVVMLVFTLTSESSDKAPDAAPSAATRP